MVVAALVSGRARRVALAFYRPRVRGRSSWGSVLHPWEGQAREGCGRGTALLAGRRVAQRQTAGRVASSGLASRLREMVDCTSGEAMQLASAQVARQCSWPGLGSARGRPDGRAGVQTTSWARCREAEVGNPGSGNLVNNPKFKIQFCNFNFSPSSWPQMKKC
jgi:hypothetical protein